MPHSLLDFAALADYLQLTREDLETLLRRHNIPSEKHAGRTMFRRKEVDAWASQHILGLAQKSLREFHRRSTAKTRNLFHQHAIISELLHPESVTAELQGRTKPAVLRAMVKLAERSEIGFDPNDLLQTLRNREELCSTALPGGIALLHPRHQEPYMFEDSFLAFGRAPAAVPFGAPDGSLTDLFFLICCQDDRIHLHVLSRLCLMASRTPVLDNLRSAPDSKAIMIFIRNSEEEVMRSVTTTP